MYPPAPASVDALATQRHYGDHIRPIWEELQRLGVAGEWHDRPPKHDRPIIVASSTDLQRVEVPAVFVEHGAGQTYLDARHPEGYAGGPKRGRVVLFICPSERVAEKNRKAYPKARSVVVGSPRLEWLRRARGRFSLDSPPPSPLAPAISFHWNCRTSPEARWAWPHYQTLTDWLEPDSIIGHGHPRSWPQLRRWWQAVGVETVDEFADVTLRASLYVVDNSSTMYEAAALGIPVVALNAPWYRRDVHHGLRFWDLIPGPQVDHPSELPAAIAEAPEWADKRDKISELVYSPSDGAARRAAEAIIETLDLWPSPLQDPSQHPPAEPTAAGLSSPPPR